MATFFIFWKREENSKLFVVVVVFILNHSFLFLQLLEMQPCFH